MYNAGKAWRQPGALTLHWMLRGWGRLAVKGLGVLQQVKPR